MSTFINVTKECAICGKQHSYTELASTYSNGTIDLDTRPCGMKRDTLSYEIQYCDNCYYANSDISATIDGMHNQLLQHPVYLAVVHDANIDATAKSFLLSGYLHANAKDYHMAGIMYLQAAWIFDDNNQVQYASRARVKALKYLTLHAEDTADMHTAVLCVDLLRRTGDFAGAIQTAQQLIDYGAEQFLAKVLLLEQKLARNNDADCHNVGEAD